MKLHTLEVEDFRGIHRARVTFGSGLTVLHGPNELGKSTLVEAIHAALFVQYTSTTTDYVQWGTSVPACVALTFEHQGRLWKVTKRFGRKADAQLESSESVDSPRFREIAKGRDVEGRVRDLLAWGIAPPGGRGAASKPESFLLTALVGRQGEVQKVFEASLSDDKDEAGRSLVNQALGALDKDPRVAALVDKLTMRVEPFFTEQGKLKTAADSPLVKRQNHLRTQQEMLARLEADAQKGEGIQADVVRLQDEREQLVADLRDAREAAAAAHTRRVQLDQRAALQHTADGLRERLSMATALQAKADELERQRAACDERLVALRAEAHAAAERAAQAESRLQKAAEDLVRAQEAQQHSAVVSQSAADKRRAELELARAAAEGRLAEVRAADEAADDVARRLAVLEEATSQRDARAAAVARAERALERATVHRALAALAARQQEVDGAAAAVAEARRLEAAALARVEAATATLRDAEAQRAQADVDPATDAARAARAELLVLAAAEAQVELDRVRAEVQALEATNADARQTRATAKAQRDAAAALDARAARRTLPTPEQMASWRALEAELRADPASGAVPTVPASVVPAATAFVGAFVAGAAAALFGAGMSVPAAVAIGVAAGVVAALAMWLSQRGRGAEQAAVADRQARRRDRWTLEVMPSLRAAGLASLADYDAAVADIERQKLEAEQARSAAAALDETAVTLEREAAVLDTRRAEADRLERAKPEADAEAVSSALAAHGRSVDALQRRASDVQAQIETERERMRADADGVVQQAREQRDAAQAEHDALAKSVTAAETTLALRRQQVDEAELARLQQRGRELDDDQTSPLSVDEATTALDEARRAQTEAVTQVQGLQAGVAEAQARASARVATLGDTPDAVRSRVEAELAGMAAELSVAQPRSLFDEGAMATAALDEAKARHTDLEAQRAAALGAQTTAATSVRACEADLATVVTDLASVRGQLSGFDVPALEGSLGAVLNDPAFLAVPDADQVDADGAASRVSSLETKLEQCTGDLSHAKGQLELTAGHVGAERLAQQRERVALADADVKECERTERGALRLLRDIERVERERATHLGRVLADPVSQAFKALTGERYGRVTLGPDLRTESIEAKGQLRTVDRMSLGAREQLATLMRLAIAGHLRTALVLDDQLVHSDGGRLAWFNDKLRESVREHGHQVIVFTCRPADYLRTESETGVTGIDLTTVVSYP